MRGYTSNKPAHPRQRATEDVMREVKSSPNLMSLEQIEREVHPPNSLPLNVTPKGPVSRSKLSTTTGAASVPTQSAVSFMSPGMRAGATRSGGAVLGKDKDHSEQKIALAGKLISK